MNDWHLFVGSDWRRHCRHFQHRIRPMISFRFERLMTCVWVDVRSNVFPSSSFFAFWKPAFVCHGTMIFTFVDLFFRLFFRVMVDRLQLWYSVIHFTFYWCIIYLKVVGISSDRKRNDRAKSTECRTLCARSFDCICFFFFSILFVRSFCVLVSGHSRWHTVRCHQMKHVYVQANGSSIYHPSISFSVENH